MAVKWLSISTRHHQSSRESSTFDYLLFSIVVVFRNGDLMIGQIWFELWLNTKRPITTLCLQFNYWDLWFICPYVYSPCHCSSCYFSWTFLWSLLSTPQKYSTNNMSPAEDWKCPNTHRLDHRTTEESMLLCFDQQIERRTQWLFFVHPFEVGCQLVICLRVRDCPSDEPELNWLGLDSRANEMTRLCWWGGWWTNSRLES